MSQHFSDKLSAAERDWLDGYLDGTIEPADFAALQDRMMQSPALRASLRRYLSLDSSLRSNAESDEIPDPWPETVTAPNHKVRRMAFLPIAAAAALAFVLGLALKQWQSDLGEVAATEQPTISTEKIESYAVGFAVVGSLFDPQWGSTQYREGDTLGSEVLLLKSGAAQIQFFSGAIMTIEGPAKISLKSAWEASCHEGAVRMSVPPAARGFKLHAPATEIVDLGTEFGLVVREGKGHVEVFDGEIAIRHRGDDEQLLTKGEALGLAPDAPPEAATAGEMAYPGAGGFGSHAAEQLLTDFERWLAHRQALASDPRLLAYYSFDLTNSDSLIPDLTIPRNPELDGAVVLTEPVDGRWPGLKRALEFRRPGSRVRVNIPGEFPAFTFAAWVRLDSLDHQYSALFMGDGYENGEPHWQIRNDGRLMLSVMVDDSRRHPKWPKSRFHHVYLSPPMWSPSMSGQWLHLASVYEPPAKSVSHYVNGERLSREAIAPDFLVDTLRIGNGEIGNWGQPFREDPSFAIRNLNGRMDEIAIFKAALKDPEIANLYQRSRASRH